MQGIYRVIAPVAILGLGAGAYYLLDITRPEPEKREDTVRPVTVFVEEAVSRGMQLDIRTQGEVRSRVSIDLVAQVGGRIAAVSPEFTEGGSVEPGAGLIE